MTINDNIKAIKAIIERESKKWNGKDAAPNLVAVSKTVGQEPILEAINSGQQIFGENKIQEIISKWPDIKTAHPTIQLHFIGHLQSNKAKEAVLYCDVIETLDRISLAKDLHKNMQKLDKWPECYIQINTGEEQQKGGVLPKDADSLIKQCLDLGIKVTGVMAIPPVDEAPGPHFALTSIIAKRNGLKNISIGMSSDYKEAIRFGATHVRVGTAIFGTRN